MINTLIHGDCLNVLPTFRSESVNLVLTDPPCLARYVDRSGRSIANDDNDAWLKPSFAEIYRNVDRFMAAWRGVGFRIVGHLKAGRKKGCPKFGSQLLGGVILVSEPAFEVPVQPQSMAGSVGAFMGKRRVVGDRVPEYSKRGHLDVIFDRQVLLLRAAMPDIGTE